jgi:hypothetical protein
LIATLPGCLQVFAGQQPKEQIMFMKTTATALTVLLMAGAAFAQSVSPGAVQLAAIAGVEPGMYSANQLIRLIDAQRDSDQQAVDFILSQSAADTTRFNSASGEPAVGAGWDMIARLNGVEPGQYTASELSAMDADRID